jgi:hypothetical protein
MKKRIDPIVLEGCEDLFAPKLQHLHFEEIRRQEFYWVGVRVFVEWFKKS